MGGEQAVQPPCIGQAWSLPLCPRGVPLQPPFAQGLRGPPGGEPQPHPGDLPQARSGTGQHHVSAQLAKRHPWKRGSERWAWGVAEGDVGGGGSLQGLGGGPHWGAGGIGVGSPGPAAGPPAAPAQGRCWPPALGASPGAEPLCCLPLPASPGRAMPRQAGPRGLPGLLCPSGFPSAPVTRTQPCEAAPCHAALEVRGGPCPEQSRGQRATLPAPPPLLPCSGPLTFPSPFSWQGEGRGCQDGRQEDHHSADAGGQAQHLGGGEAACEVGGWVGGNWGQRRTPPPNQSFNSQIPGLGIWEKNPHQAALRHLGGTAGQQDPPALAQLSRCKRQSPRGALCRTPGPAASQACLGLHRPRPAAGLAQRRLLLLLHCRGSPCQLGSTLQLPSPGPGPHLSCSRRPHEAPQANVGGGCREQRAAFVHSARRASGGGGRAEQQPWRAGGQPCSRLCSGQRHLGRGGEDGTVPAPPPAPASSRQTKWAFQDIKARGRSQSHAGWRGSPERDERGSPLNRASLRPPTEHLPRLTQRALHTWWVPFLLSPAAWDEATKQEQPTHYLFPLLPPRAHPPPHTACSGPLRAELAGDGHRGGRRTTACPLLL